MKKQRYMAPMKEQNKTPKKEMNKMETSNLLDLEFKTLFIRKLNELSENLNIIKIKKKIQSKVKDTLTEMKNNLQGNDSGVDEAENQINDLEYKEGKNNRSEQQEESRLQKKDDRASRLWDNFEQYNICIIGVPVGEEKEQEIGNLFENDNERKVP